MEMGEEQSGLKDSTMDCNAISTLVESDPEYIKSLLDQNIFNSKRDKRSKTLRLLGFAIKRQKIEVARMLLEYGVCVKSPVDDLDNSALQLAVTLRDKPMIDLLLKYKSDPKVTDSKFQSLLHLVLENVTPNVETSRAHQEVQEKIIEIMNLLVGLGLDVNKRTNRNETPLHYAVQRRLIKVARFLIEHGAKVNCVNKKGETIVFALHDSDVKIRQMIKTLIRYRQAMIDSVNFLNYLISVGLNVDIKTKKKKSVLESATESNTKHIMNIFLEHTKDLLFTTTKNQTILHLVFMRHSDGLLQLEYNNDIALKLVDRGVPIDVIDDNGDTPFHLAARQRRFDVLSKMLDRKMDIHAGDNGRTPIWRTAMDTLVDVQYEDRIIALVCQGVDVNLKNRDGITPVETAARFKLAKLMKVLEALGADFNVKNASNENLLHIISNPVRGVKHTFDKSIVDLLISKGCEVNAYDANGTTPLHVACQLENNVEVVKALIEHGAKINRREKITERTPLHLAAWIGDIDVVKCLIESGAEIDYRDESSSTAMHLAVRGGYTDIVKILAEAGADVNATNDSDLTPLLLVTRYNFCDQAYSVVDTLIMAGADFQCRVGDLNFTLLHEAVSIGNTTVIKCLVDNGADVSCQDNSDKLAPLHVAAEVGDVQIVSMLIEKGADIHCREKSRLTPLHIAVQADNEEIIRHLVKCGANINETERAGRTPLHIALTFENKAAETLLELGARMDVKDSAGYTPLHEALDRENLHGFDWLIEFRANVNDIGTPDNVMFLEELVERRTIAECFINHLVKLMAIKFPVSKIFETVIDMDHPQIKTMYQDCLTEVALLKEPVIKDDEESSLYSLLHMHPYQRYRFYNKKEFKIITDRKARNKTYPIYCEIIMASYRETMSYEKRFLTPPARCAWYNLTEIYLPVICIDCIFDNLDLDDLKRMIQDDEKPKRKESPNSTADGIKSAKKQRKTL